MPYTASLSFGVRSLNVVDLRKIRSGSCESAYAGKICGERDTNAARRAAVRDIAIVRLLACSFRGCERIGAFRLPANDQSCAIGASLRTQAVECVANPYLSYRQNRS